MSKVTRFIVPATTLTALLALVLTLAPSFVGAANANPAATPAPSEQPLLSQLSSFTTIQGAAAAMTKTASAARSGTPTMYGTR